MMAGALSFLLVAPCAAFLVRPLPHFAMASTHAVRRSVPLAAYSTTPEAAYALLEGRVANSRVGPIARGFLDCFKAIPIFQAQGAATQNLWLRALGHSLWQPVDIATILFIAFGRKQALRALHTGVSALLPADSNATYEDSVFPVLSNILLMFGRMLTLLVLTDAASYTMCKAGFITEALAGTIPEALDTVGYSLLLGFTLTRIKKHLLRKAGGFAAGQKLKGGTALLDRLWGAAIWFFAAAGGAKVLSFELGFRLKSVLALGGLSSLVFGLACQTPLANVVKGLVIAASGAFATGDKISAAGISGVVEEFGWYQSRIRTDANELVTLPNAALADKQIVNLSRKTATKMDANLRLRYSDLPKMGKVIDELREVAQAQPSLAPGKTPAVYLKEFGESAILVVATIHLQSGSNANQIKQDFHLQLADVLTRNGVEFQPKL